MTDPIRKTAPQLSLSDIQPFPHFARTCEQEGFATTQQLRWWVRYRNQNGLTSSGAVIEKRPNPKSRKPQLFFVVPRFIDWLATNTVKTR